jgi:thioesterase domain-containing protein
MPRYQTLMPIRTKGSAAPLFCVHGEPLKMAQRINPNRPIYGLSHVYHSDFLEETPESIEELAAQYLGEVRQVQPVGPYHFCGFSAGGLIAIEMAGQLLRAGEKVGALVLVEPTVMNRNITWASKVAGTLDASEGMLENIKQLLIRAPTSIRVRTRNGLRKLVAKMCFLFGRPLPQDLRWIGYLESLGPAIRKYEYKPLGCHATLLYQQMDEEYTALAKEYWGALFLQGITVEIFANAQRHQDFMLEPSLSQTAELIDRLCA